MSAPTELLVFRFERGGRFDGQIIGALERLETEAMSVRDVLFVHRDEAGELHAVQARGGDIGTLLDYRIDAREGRAPQLAGDAGTDRGIAPEAIAELAEPLTAGEAAMLLLVEHTWREVLDRAVTAAGGVLVR